MKKNINKKKLMTFSLLGVLVLGLGSAALVGYFGLITTTVDVHQSIVLDDGDLDIIDEISHPAPGGEEFCFKHFLRNDASVDITIDLVNDCTAENVEGGWMNCVGVEKTHYVMPEITTLELTSKDSNWVATGDMKATLTFDTVNPRFVGTLTTTGLVASTNYALIYYADKPDRYVNWGGDNPGKVITTFQGDQTNLAINTNLGMNLPTEPDKNIEMYNYCVLDGYEHCHGAKLWIVPTSDLTGEKLTGWNPSNYLFETDMITYFDCNINVLTSNYPINEYGEDVTSITLESGEEKPFFNCYDFDIAVETGTYTLTTKVLPVTA